MRERSSDWASRGNTGAPIDVAPPGEIFIVLNKRAKRAMARNRRNITGSMLSGQEIDKTARRITLQGKRIWICANDSCDFSKHGKQYGVIKITPMRVEKLQRGTHLRGAACS